MPADPEQLKCWNDGCNEPVTHYCTLSTREPHPFCCKHADVVMELKNLIIERFRQEEEDALRSHGEFMKAQIKTLSVELL